MLARTEPVRLWKSGRGRKGGGLVIRAVIPATGEAARPGSPKSGPAGGGRGWPSCPARVLGYLQPGQAQPYVPMQWRGTAAGRPRNSLGFSPLGFHAMLGARSVS
jgi:hypothetical protein